MDILYNFGLSHHLFSLSDSLSAYKDNILNTNNGRDFMEKVILKNVSKKRLMRGFKLETMILF